MALKIKQSLLEFAVKIIVEMSEIKKNYDSSKNSSSLNNKNENNNITV